MQYTAYTDGGNRGGNPGRAAWAYVIKDAAGDTVHQHGECIEDALRTNNHAEYMGVLSALMWGVLSKTQNLLFRSDSQLIVRQLLGQWYKVIDNELKPLHEACRVLLNNTGARIEWVRGHVYCEGNNEADALYNKVQDERR